MRTGISSFLSSLLPHLHSLFLWLMFCALRNLRHAHNLRLWCRVLHLHHRTLGCRCLPLLR